MDDTGLAANKFYGEIEEIIDEVEKRFERMKNFEIISYPHDHHYIEYKRDARRIPPGSSQAQKIEQEWLLLESNLPNSIFVRAYETRIDLMRAVIVGTPDTPYGNGLFFFDILFPRSYPACPPKLHYHSYGIDLNPRFKV